MEEEMKFMRKQGMNLEEIGNVCGVSRTIVNYHLNKDYRANQRKNSRKWQKKNMTKKKLQKRNKKYQPYNNNYIKERYHTDPNFRKKFIQTVRNSQDKNRKVWTENGLCSRCGGKKKNKKRLRCEKCRKFLRIYQRNKKRKELR